MEDREIVALFWARDEEALQQTERKYRGYLKTAAGRILAQPEDVEECVNDALLAAWNSIPPQKPERLSTYLGKLIRRAAIDRLRQEEAGKRGGGEAAASLEELEETLAAEGDFTEGLEAEELAERISRFLAGEAKLNRQLFLGRYYFFKSVKELAKEAGCGESQVKMRLKRTRDRLARVLEEEEYR